MSDKKKIINLGLAVIILASRLEKLEQDEEYRQYLLDIIEDIGKDIYEIKYNTTPELK